LKIKKRHIGVMLTILLINAMIWVISASPAIAEEKMPENLGGIVFDDKEIPCSLRIPSKHLTPGTHKISFLDKKCQPLLLFTNLELLDVNEVKDGVEYTINGYGNGVLRFEEVSRDKIRATDETGKPVAFDYIPTSSGDSIQIRVKGKAINLRILK